MTGAACTPPFQVTPGEVVFKNCPMAAKSWVGSARGLSTSTPTLFECFQNEKKGKMTSTGDCHVAEVTFKGCWGGNAGPEGQFKARSAELLSSD